MKRVLAFVAYLAFSTGPALADGPYSLTLPIILNNVPSGVHLQFHCNFGPSATGPWTIARPPQSPQDYSELVSTGANGQSASFTFTASAPANVTFSTYECYVMGNKSSGDMTFSNLTIYDTAWSKASPKFRITGNFP